MKKALLAVLSGALICLLMGCSTYTEAIGPDGTSVKHIGIAPGTSITTPKGCINSAGRDCEPLSPVPAQ